MRRQVQIWTDEWVRDELRPGAALRVNRILSRVMADMDWLASLGSDGYRRLDRRGKVPMNVWLSEVLVRNLKMIAVEKDMSLSLFLHLALVYGVMQGYHLEEVA